MPHPTHRHLRKARLCAGLCLALAVGSETPPLIAAEVMNCDDGGPGSGSLRDVIANAASGDTIDLSQLPTRCGMAESVITLTNGEIKIAQDSLKLQGPAQGVVMIEPVAGSQFRIFEHTGAGLLVINDLAIANGNVQAGANDANGGCVSSKGSVFFTRSSLKDCTVAGAHANGGAAYVSGSIVLLHSIVSGSKAVGSVEGKGGGLYSHLGTSILYSSVSNNEASLYGGGVYSHSTSSSAYTSVSYSTISGNVAAQCGGAYLTASSGFVVFTNSTISGNSAKAVGALCFKQGDVRLSNSTIAFNSDESTSGGVVMFGGGSLDLQSMIIALNQSALGVPDLNVIAPVTVSGSDNLIMSANSNVPPSVIKIASDPNLNPQLQFNGGRTRTHALLPGSPAIGAGNDNAGEWTDQRGRGYPRASGPSASTDIGSIQFDSIFFGDFES
jgi:hypothetical protein